MRGSAAGSSLAGEALLEAVIGACGVSLDGGGGARRALGWFSKGNPVCKSPERELRVCGQRAQDSAFPRGAQDAGPGARRHFPFPALADFCLFRLADKL